MAYAILGNDIVIGGGSHVLAAMVPCRYYNSHEDKQFVVPR